MSKCVIIGCDGHGFSLVNPYYDAEEIVRIAKKHRSEKMISGANKWLLKIKEMHGKYYDQIGISLDDIIKRLNEVENVEN